MSAFSFAFFAASSAFLESGSSSSRTGRAGFSSAVPFSPSAPLPASFPGGVNEVYRVSARSDVLGAGQTRLERSTGSEAAALASVVAGPWGR